jgi:hypothetical protein
VLASELGRDLIEVSMLNAKHKLFLFEVRAMSPLPRTENRLAQDEKCDVSCAFIWCFIFKNCRNERRSGIYLRCVRNSPHLAHGDPRNRTPPLTTTLAPYHRGNKDLSPFTAQVRASRRGYPMAKAATLKKDTPAGESPRSTDGQVYPQYR